MAREIELKFEVEPGARNLLLDSLLLEDKGARRVPQETVYYDTPSGTIRRRGYSLRIRRSGKKCVQTIKHRADSPAGLFSRDEWETAVAGLELDFEAIDKTPLGQWLTPKARKKLQPTLCTRFERTTWRLQRGASRIEVTLDEGTIEAGGAELPLAELEMELRKGDTSALFELAEQASRVLPLRLGVLSKAERGFALAEGNLERASKADRIRLRPSMTVGDAFAAAAHSCLRHFRLNEPLVITQRNPAALHQARVAIRRLRSALSLFRPVVADWEFDRMRADLRWLAGKLGAARNLDVLLERVSNTASDEGADVTIARLSDSREAEYDEVVALLNSERLRALMLDIVRWIETGGWRSRPRASKPLAPIAGEQLGRRWRRIRKRGGSLEGINAPALHDLRIDVKKMRYSAEFLSGLFEDRSRQMGKFIDGLEELQDRLGDLNDSETARELVHRMELAEGEEAQLALNAVEREAEDDKAVISAQKAYDAVCASAGYWA